MQCMFRKRTSMQHVSDVTIVTFKIKKIVSTSISADADGPCNAASCTIDDIACTQSCTWIMITRCRGFTHLHVCRCTTRDSFTVMPVYRKDKLIAARQCQHIVNGDRLCKWEPQYSTLPTELTLLGDHKPSDCVDESYSSTKFGANPFMGSLWTHR